MEGKKSLLRVVLKPSRCWIEVVHQSTGLRGCRPVKNAAYINWIYGPHFWQVDTIWHVEARCPLPYATFLLKKRKYKAIALYFCNPQLDAAKQRLTKSIRKPPFLKNLNAALITKSRRAFFCVYTTYSAMARSKEIPLKTKCFANYLCVIGLKLHNVHWYQFSGL